MHMSKSSQSGFTLIETLIAIFILALTIGALLTLTAGGFFSIRYAKNDIVASNLLQESLEYIHNSRDTASQKEMTWTVWKNQFADCYGSDGCIINPYPSQDLVSNMVASCGTVTNGGGPNNCDPLVYLSNGIYVQGSLSSAFQTTGTPITTSFVRNIMFKDITGGDGPQIEVTARMDWINGTNPKHLTQTIILTPWNINQ